MTRGLYPRRVLASACPVTFKRPFKIAVSANNVAPRASVYIAFCLWMWLYLRMGYILFTYYGRKKIFPVVEPTFRRESEPW